MLDVLVAGAGPAGAIAARALAQRGARVLMVDRDEFPRNKLCGDTLNPGALRMLDEIGLVGGARDLGVPIAGMRITGPRPFGVLPPVDITACYGAGQFGLALRRADLDSWLLEEAIAAGVRFEPHLTVKSALTYEEHGDVAVRGLVFTDKSGRSMRVPASVTIGADGRRSAVARSVNIGVVPESPRRWAYGAYFDCAKELSSSFGEMHVRKGWYAGVAPMPDDQTNVCVVVESPKAAGDPLEFMRTFLRRDHSLAERFAGEDPVSDVTVLGPLSVDVESSGLPGLLLAGDAAGFVDPMTGDGLNLAIRGAILAAAEASRVLESGDWFGAVERLDAERTNALGSRIRLNKTLRRLTSSNSALDVAAMAALMAPGVLRRVVAMAGGVS